MKKKILMILLSLFAASCCALALGCGPEESAPSPLAEIQIKTEPNKSVYFINEKFSAVGGKLLAVYEDKSTNELELKSDMCQVDLSSQGKKSVEVSYTEAGVTKTASFPVYVAKKKVSHASSLQENIEQSEKGDILLVAAGTYYEQLIFDNKELTLIGDGTVLIAGPEDYAEIESTAKVGKEAMDYSGIVTIRNDSDVTLMKMTVFGDKKLAAKETKLTHETRYTGIAVINSSAKLVEVKVRDMVFPADLQGIQNGFGIYAAATAGERKLSMKKCLLEDFNKCGLLLRASNLSAELDDCTLLGRGNIDVNAQNGIQTACRTVVKNCVFRGFNYTKEGAEEQAAAILRVGDKPDPADFTNNTFENVQNEDLKA